MTARIERRLAAIMAADIVGYSHLIELDEDGTLAAIKVLRREIIDPLLAEHHGRIAKLMGDGAIVEFGSVVDALACAVAIQKEVSARQKGFGSDRRIVFRIGINLGDVVVEDGDLLGMLSERRRNGDLPFSALICWGVESGGRFRTALEAAGIRVPDDLSIVLLGRPDMKHEHDDFFTTFGATTSEQSSGLFSLVNWRWQNPDEPPAIRFLDGESVVREPSLAGAAALNRQRRKASA